MLPEDALANRKRLDGLAARQGALGPLPLDLKDLPTAMPLDLKDDQGLESISSHIRPLQSGAAAQLFEALSKELGDVWSELGASTSERLDDAEAVAAASCEVLRGRLALWAARRARLAAVCEGLEGEARAGLAALPGRGEAAELAASAALPLRDRPAALQRCHAGILRLLRCKRAEVLATLGRRACGGGPADEDVGEGLAEALAGEVLRLEEDLRERRVSVAQATLQLHGIWEDLAVQPEDAADEALQEVLHAGSQGLTATDAQHELLLSCLEQWRSERERRYEELMALHGRMRALGQVCLPPAELGELERFLAAHGRCRDAPACGRREHELHLLARGLRHRLLRRRREALAGLGRAEQRGDGADGEPVHAAGLRALAAAVEELERELGACRGARALEAARCARALWQELGEEPEAGGRDSVAAGLLAEELAAEPAASAREEAAVEMSLAAWQARHTEVARMVERLHAELSEFQDAGRPFLLEHGTLHRKDRAACKARLRELREEEKRADAERSACERLQRHTNRGLAEPEAYLTSMRELREYQRSTFGVRG